MAHGVKEALFTLGDKPERRYATARQALALLGHETTLDYLEASAALVLEGDGIAASSQPRPHGRGLDAAIARAYRHRKASCWKRPPSGSRGVAALISARPTSIPSARLAAIDAAGRAGVPFTTGILIGIGETRFERIEALLAIRDLHERHGHIQEVIIQNFRAKPGTRMADAPEPSLEEQVWTIAAARLIFGPKMNIQTPPNLRPDGLGSTRRVGHQRLGRGFAGDAGPRQSRSALAASRRRSSRQPRGQGAFSWSASRSIPAFVDEPGRWIAPELQTPVLRLADGRGLAREDRWSPGGLEPLPKPAISPLAVRRCASLFSRGGKPRSDRGRFVPGEAEIEALFDARGADFAAVCRAADRLRRARAGDRVTYVVNRNINYTNICTYGCKFCAFSKGRHNLGHRDQPYDLRLDEIAGRVRRRGRAARPRSACKAAFAPATPATPISRSSRP